MNVLDRIVRAEDVRLYRDAASALRIAEEDAAALRATAQRDAETARTELLATAQAEQNRETTRILIATEAEAQRRLSALPAEIASAIADAVAKVIGSLDLAHAVARAAQKAVSELTERHTVFVRVNPIAEDRTRAAVQSELTRVVADPSLAPDACILETPSGFVRAGLNEQIAILREALLNAAIQP